MNSLALVLLLVPVNLVSCKRDGAPPGSCRRMVPGHFASGAVFSGQKGKSPYVLSATWDSQLRMVRLSVTPEEGKAVAGFLIQARFKEEGPAVGRFVNITEDTNAKYQDCTGAKFAPESSVTHTNPQDKKKLLFYWEPPKDVNKTKNVTFYATLAQSFEVFWIKQESESLNLNVMEEDDKGQTMTVIPSVNPTAEPEVNTTEVSTDGNVKNTSPKAHTTDTVATTDMTTGPTDRGSSTASLHCLSLIIILLITTIHVSLS